MIETEAQRTRTGMLYALATFGAWGLNPFYFKAVDQFPAIEVLATGSSGRASCWRR